MNIDEEEFNGTSSNRECVCKNLFSFQVLQDLNVLYESKIRAIETSSPIDFQVEISLLKKWVKDLTMQNISLVQAVQELEKEAAGQIDQTKFIQDESLKFQRNCACSSLLTENVELKRRLSLETDDHNYSNIPKVEMQEGICIKKEHETSEDIISLRKKYKSELHKKNLELAEVHRKYLSLKDKFKSGKVQSEFKDDIIKGLAKKLNSSQLRLDKFQNTTVLRENTHKRCECDIKVTKQVRRDS